MQDYLGASLWSMSNASNGMGRTFDTLWLTLDAGQSNRANASTNICALAGPGMFGRIVANSIIIQFSSVVF